MKTIYLLKSALNPLEQGMKDSPWVHTWDCAYGFVICADAGFQGQMDARALAAEEHGDEGKDTWMDSKLTSCEIVGVSDSLKDEIILRDFCNG